jgi:hypothetical protein
VFLLCHSLPRGALWRPAMRRWLALLLLVMGLATLPGCTVAPWREQPPPWSEATLAGADDVRVLMRDGNEYELSAPRIEASAAGARLVGAIDGAEYGVLLEDVTRLETRHTEVLPLIADVAIAAVVVAGVVVLACAGGGGGGGGGCSLSGLNFSSCDEPKPKCVPPAMVPRSVAPRDVAPHAGVGGSVQRPRAR